jgi:hypothetical protein
MGLRIDQRGSHLDVPDRYRTPISLPPIEHIPSPRSRTSDQEGNIAAIDEGREGAFNKTIQRRPPDITYLEAVGVHPPGGLLTVVITIVEGPKTGS